jgi:diphthine-ammonia ligase
MKVAVLYSGGKDSNIALYKSYMQGYDVACLITLIPCYDDSMLFHYPNASHTSMQAEAIGLPLIQAIVKGVNDEYCQLKYLLSYAKRVHGIEGFVSGALSSMYQYSRFNEVASMLELKHIAPCWGEDQLEHMRELITNKVTAMITSVSAYGLDMSMLGRIIDGSMLEMLNLLSKRYGFNLTFEGGEAETFVLDMPLFKRRIKIKDYTTYWDGVRGHIEFGSISLEDK